MALAPIEARVALALVDVDGAVLASETLGAAAFVAVDEVVAHLAVRAGEIEAVVDVVLAGKALEPCTRMKERVVIDVMLVGKIIQ